MNKKKIILLIDDEVDFCALMKMHLPVVGNFEVICANSGKDGLKLAKRVKPDVIILDVLMPHLDGFAVLKELKKDDSTIAIPVIMLSALDEDVAKIKSSELYDEMYITKPVDVYQLKEKIEEILKIRGSRDTGQKE